MGKKTSVALLTGVAGLGFVMMGCPPAEQPPAGERIVEPAPPPTTPTTPTYRDPVETYPPQDTRPPTDPPPLEPDPMEPMDPMEPQDPQDPMQPGGDPGNLPPPPPPQGS
jgi:hypothetical protein